MIAGVHIEAIILALVVAALAGLLSWAVRGRNRDATASASTHSRATDKSGTGRPWIPSGLSTVTPYLTVPDTAVALEFYTKAFDAVELPGRLTAPDGMIMHAMVRIEDTVIMLADEFPGMPEALAPGNLGGSPVKLNLFVADAQSVVNQAVAAGGELLAPVSQQFVGQISGRIKDPAGHLWLISSQNEVLDTAEVEKRFLALFD